MTEVVVCINITPPVIWSAHIGLMNINNQIITGVQEGKQEQCLN